MPCPCGGELLTTLQRELVSRAAAAVLGAAFVFGGWRCVSAALGVAESERERVEARDRRVGHGDQRSTGVLPLYLAGGLLLLLGLPTLGFAVLPPRAVERVFRPKAPVTSESPDWEFDRRAGDWWRHWWRWWD